MKPTKKNPQRKIDIRKYFEQVRKLEEVSYKEFYRTLFPEGSLEEKGQYETGKYTGIIVEVTGQKKADGKAKVLRHTVTDDLEILDDVTMRENFCLIAPISYIGKSRHSENARLLYAIAIDLDGIEKENNLEVLFNQIEKNEFFAEGGVFWGIPRPTFLVSSGTGLHLYYVFEEPIRLYPNVAKELEKLKRRMTWQIWTQGASERSDDIEYESLFQGFRMVGTTAKKDRTKRGTKAIAYRFGDKVTIEYLNKSVPPEHRFNVYELHNKWTLEEAKNKFPQWYDRRIVKKAPRGTWTCKRDLYDWWLRRIREVKQGHRYWSVMTLAVYAKKCAISYDELVADAIDLIPFLDSLGKNDPFTKSDVMKAVEAYNDNYMTYPIDTIVTRTGIPIQKNKRNYRPQKEHLVLARGIKDIKKKMGEVTDGRPKGSGTKAKIIQQWRKVNPEGRKIDCERATGLSRHTVLKWWDHQPDYHKSQVLAVIESEIAVAVNKEYKEFLNIASQAIESYSGNISSEKVSKITATYLRELFWLQERMIAILPGGDRRDAAYHSFWSTYVKNEL